MSDHSRSVDLLSDGVVPFVPFGFLKDRFRVADPPHSGAEKIDRNVSVQNRVPDARQVDQFEKHAFSWHTSDRKRKLLLHISGSLAKARDVLEQHSVRPIVSPLAQEYLELSLRFDRRRRLRRIALSAAALLMLGVYLTGKLLPESDPAVAREVTLAPYQTAQTEIISTASPEPADPAEFSASPLTTKREQPEPDESEISIGQNEPLLAAADSLEPAEPSLPELLPSEIGFPAAADQPELISEWIDRIETKQSAGDRDEVFDLLRRLHDSEEERGNRLSASLSHEETKRLAIVIGKLSLIHGDHPAARIAWQWGYSEKAEPGSIIGFDLLLARASSTAGRIEDASAFLGSRALAEKDEPAIRALLHSAFEEPAPAIEAYQNLLASDPDFSRSETIASLDWSDEARSLLEELRQKVVD